MEGMDVWIESTHPMFCRGLMASSTRASLNPASTFPNLRGRNFETMQRTRFSIYKSALIYWAIGTRGIDPLNRH